VQGLECSGAGFLESEPKQLNPVIKRREAVLGHSEVDRHEARRRPRQLVEQPALINKCLPERMRQSGMRLIFRSSGIRVWLRMPSANGVKAVQTGLRRHYWPVRVPAASLSQDVQHRMLNRIRYLHHDQQKVGLPFTPGYVLRGVVVDLSKSAGVQKPEQRDLGWHVVERGGSRAGFKPFSDLCVRIACQSGDDGALSCPRLA
jgi:hypothetical protein